LNSFGKTPQVAVSREQENVVDIARDVEHVGRELDAYISIELPSIFPIIKFLYRLRSDRISVVVEPVDEGPNVAEIRRVADRCVKVSP